MDGKPSEKLESQPAVPPLNDKLIANELVRARKVLGWTQSELHQRTGISRETIKQYETGRHLPGAREIGLLSTALGISPNRLLLGSDDFNPPPSVFEGMIEHHALAEYKNFMKFMILYQMLLPAERKALFTLIEPILVGRLGGVEFSKAMELSEAAATLAAPMGAEISKKLGEEFEKKSVTQRAKEMREATKQTK